MFDLAWSEIALIGVIALIVIGPKDLPGAIRGVAQMMGKARRMAGEFQGHVDEMVREAKLDEVKREIDQFKTNVQTEVSRATQMDEWKRDVVDPIRETARDLERPFDPPPAPSSPPSPPPEAAPPGAAPPEAAPPGAAPPEAAPPEAAPPEAPDPRLEPPAVNAQPAATSPGPAEPEPAPAATHPSGSARA
jgi:sec-independent protein translocase protein TatB